MFLWRVLHTVACEKRNVRECVSVLVPGSLIMLSSTFSFFYGRQASKSTTLPETMVNHHKRSYCWTLASRVSFFIQPRNKLWNLILSFIHKIHMSQFIQSILFIMRQYVRELHTYTYMRKLVPHDTFRRVNLGAYHILNL